MYKIRAIFKHYLYKFSAEILANKRTMTMLKGVNKQILEVTNPDSPYFEKIIFFVRPSSQNTDSKKLHKEAEKISTSTAVKPPKQKLDVKKTLAFAGYSAITIMSGVGITFLLDHLNII